jgi:hypothetical protein
MLKLLLAMLLFATPLYAVKLKLKAEAAEFDATVTRLEGDTVHYRKGRKDFTAKLDDFEPASAFLIRKDAAGNAADARLELARFALLRGLYAEARVECEAAAANADLKAEADRIRAIARALEADALYDKGVSALDALNVEEAGRVLRQVDTDFGDTPAAAKARILLGTLNRVELEIKARQLEEEARKAQEVADDDERKKRRPIDEWLAEFETQLTELTRNKATADQECLDLNINKGLPRYDETVKSLETIRKSISQNRHLLKFRGQEELATRIDDGCRQLMIECFERWAYFLYRAARYETAHTIVSRGIALDPKDRRLLSLKVDIDEIYDKRG